MNVKTIILLFVMFVISLFLLGCNETISDNNQPTAVNPNDDANSQMNLVEEKLVKLAEEEFNKAKAINPNSMIEFKLQACSDKDNHKLYRMSYNGGFSGSDTYFDGSGKQFRQDTWDDTYDPSVPGVDRDVQYICEGEILYNNENKDEN